MNDQTDRDVREQRAGMARRDLLSLASLAAGYATVHTLALAATVPRGLKLRRPQRKLKGRVGRFGRRAIGRVAPGLLTPAPPPTPAQQELARYLADEMRHEIVSAASAPLTTRFPRGSAGEAVQRLLRTRKAPDQAKTRTRAAALLRASAAKRKAMFGRFAGRGATVHQRTRGATDRILAGKFRAAFDEKLAKAAGGAVKIQPKSRTALEIVLSHELHQYASRLEINTPQRLTFRWNTKEPGATHAVWKIKLPTGVRPTAATTGYARKAPGSQFYLDLARHLPKTPPATPATYYVQVQPMKGGTAAGKGFALKPTAVGAPSNWVPITYKKSTYVQPKFDLPKNLGHYQRIELYINKVHCVEETGEASASDEILLGGFFALANGTVKQTGLWTVSEDFDKGETEPHPSKRPIRWASFKLFHTQFPKGNLLGKEPVDSVNIPWPRVYTFGFIMGERDAGGGFPAIVTELVKALLDKIAPYVKKYLAAAIGTGIGAAVGSALGPIGTIIGSVVGAIVGQLVDWIFSIFKEIFDDPDDVLAERTYLLNLSSSRAEEIHKLPGTVKKLPNGKTEFVSKSQTIRFVGGDDSAGGIYDVEVFWKATSRVFDY